MTGKRFGFHTMKHVEDANEKNGHNWFSPETMSFFNCVIETELLEDGYFVTSERYDYEGPKQYTARRVKDTEGRIETIGQFNVRETKKEALKAIHEHRTSYPE